MGAASKDDFLGWLRLAANINEQGQQPPIQRLADTLDIGWGKLAFVTQIAHGRLIGLLGKVSLTIRTSAQNIMFDLAVAQQLGQAVNQYRFAAMRRATNHDSRELLHGCSYDFT